MKQQYLEAGQIANTHGLTGELKIVPWGDGPELLSSMDTIYVDDAPIKVKSTRIHKSNVLAYLEGVNNVNDAMRLKGKTVCVDRDHVTLPDGHHFIVDLLGLTVIDYATGQSIGTVAEVLTPPAHNVYVVKGEQTYMIPAVDAFIAENNPQEGYIKVHLMEGLEV